MLVSQGGGCAICGESLGTRALPIDHDHNTGTNRGILCSLCNGGLGMFRDRTALLESAIQYLEKYA